MALELIFNGLFLIVSIICFADITIIAPEPTPGSMDAAQWPQWIFGLMVICLIINMIKIWKATSDEKRNFDDIKQISLRKIITSKLFVAIMIMILYVILLKNVGFIPGSLVFSAAYITLLGERRPVRIAIATLVMVAIIYALFINLEIMLPRGIGVFRDFHLLMESIIRV